MPKYKTTDRTGDIGVDIVSLQVKRELSWLFREQPKNDLGIDGHIEVLQEDGESTGRLIAAQIKTGESYLKYESDEGFDFYGEAKHLNYWLQHSLPVIVILCDDKKDVCYWVEVSRTNVTRTNKAWKVLVPKKQILAINSKTDLKLICSTPQHTDIVELTLFRFLNEKYHKYSEFGRFDICPLIHEPRDFMYFTCMGDFEKSSDLVYVAHHYDIFKDLDLSILKKFVDWRDLNISSCGHQHLNPQLYVFYISEQKQKLCLSDDIIEFMKKNSFLHVFRLLYSMSNIDPDGHNHFYSLTELNENDEEIFMY